MYSRHTAHLTLGNVDNSNRFASFQCTGVRDTASRSALDVHAAIDRVRMSHCRTIWLSTSTGRSSNCVLQISIPRLRDRAPAMTRSLSAVYNCLNRSRGSALAEVFTKLINAIAGAHFPTSPSLPYVTIAS